MSVSFSMKKQTPIEFYLEKRLLMILMSLKKRKKKKFYSATGPLPLHLPPKVYLVYRFEPGDGKIVSDPPYSDLTDAKEAMEIYLSQGMCAWITTYNE